MHENEIKNEQGDTNVSSDATEKLKSELEIIKERAAYLASDFENYRRRVEKERLQTISMAQDSVLKDILPIVDDFDRAFADAEKKPELSSYLSGFELIYKALQKMLQSHNVTEIEAKGDI